jgi:sodium-dependent dicarboxylate transporter 2/3/5
MGGFMIAMAIEKWNLHKRIALNTIAFIGTNIQRIILGFMIATAFLSMWISNSATSLMMLPIAIAVVTQLSQNSNPDEFKSNRIGKALMLGIAYSASIGGISTLIGTPTNIILAGVVKEMYGYEISFSQWMIFGLPISIILLFLCWLYLVKWAYPFEKDFSVAGGKEEIYRQLKQLGSMTVEEKRVSWVFGLVSFAWIVRSFLLQEFIPELDDTIIAIAGVLVLFVIPSSNPKTKLLDWKTAEKIPWGILLLFGGGLSLAEGFKETGLATWIGSQFVFLDFIAFGLFLLIIIAVVNFLTEITSNVATASMILPILAAVSLSMNVHPFGLMVGATLAASCAFMLPVATPPNAVVFGSGYLSIPDMFKAGLWMNIFSILLITLFTYYILPLLWNLDLNIYPF